MSHDLFGHVRSRPIRIAFLIQDSEYIHLILDGIFAHCYSRWGGRFSPIVLCDNGSIPDTYWPWLGAYDPDIVYSYLPLEREIILEIHERLNPAQFALHRLDEGSPRLDIFGFAPKLDFKPLSSLSTIFRQVRFPRFGEPLAPLKIIDAWSGYHPTRTLTDNFGLYRWSKATGIFPSDAAAAAQLLTIADPAAREKNPATVPRGRPLIDSELDAMSAFAHGKAHSMALASMVFAPKLETRGGDAWSGTFNLVVGDTVTDRVLFWNARLMIPEWLDSEPCCFRTTIDKLRDPAFAAILGELLRHRNHVNYGSGGESQTMVRSMSLSTEDLEEATRIVRQRGTWGAVRTQRVAGLAAVVPSEEALQRARERTPIGRSLKFEWGGETARPPASPPEHLADVPPNQTFGEGFWASDFEFQHEGFGTWLSNTNRWMLPKRWRLPGAFRYSYVRPPSFQVPPPARRSQNGALCIFTSQGATIDKINVPTPEVALWHAFVRDGAWSKEDVARGRVTPAPKVADAFPSNEARYLTGVLGLAGGLTEAANLLLHPFLKDLLARFGGTPNLPAEKVQPTINDLRKRAQRESPFDLHDEQERAVLANMLLKASRGIGKPLGWATLKSLKEAWKTYRENYWSRHSKPSGDPTVDWEAEEANSLDECLIYMRGREMIFQGYQWSCKKCHHRNWINFDALEREPPCVVCKTPTTMPVAIDWVFRPNVFLIESLRDHSVLSLLWVLDELAGSARSSFIYVGPTTFSFNVEGMAQKSAAEADLLILKDGVAIICEVKSSWSHLRAKDIEKLVELSKRLRPDKSLLAVMGGENVLESQLAAAKKDLEEHGITFEIMRFDPSRERHGGPYLH